MTVQCHILEASFTQVLQGHLDTRPRVSVILIDEDDLTGKDAE